jgi:signal transduction histidine kinase
MLQSLPQLLLREPPVPTDSSAADVVRRYARLQDAVLAEMSLRGIDPSIPELRALCAALHSSASSEITERAHRADPSKLESQPDSETGTGMHADLLRKVAHDLRTPVQAILGWVSLLKSDRLTSEARNRALQAIERNAKAQSELITEVLQESAGRPA